MCGRYVVTQKPDELAALFAVDRIALDEPVEADYNVAPTKNVPTVLTRERRDEPGELERLLRAARWGLVPSWAKDPSVGNRLINARVETAAEKPSFRQAFAKRRCILPAAGYYEWQEQPALAGGKKAPKQPFFIHRPDDETLAMAGLYEWWRDPTREPDDEHAWLLSVTVLTTDATDELGRIHDRAPLIVPTDAYGMWLMPQPGDADELRSLLIPATVGMRADPISTAVNNVANQGPDLIKPLTEE